MAQLYPVWTDLFTVRQEQHRLSGYCQDITNRPPYHQMADLTIKPNGRGLSAEERKDMTFGEYRQERLIALSDGEPIERTDPGVREISGKIYDWDDAAKKMALDKGLKAVSITTTGPTVGHMSAALSIAASSLRSYEDGSASPRWEIGPMVDLAETLGLTVEELSVLIENSARAGAIRRKEKAAAAAAAAAA